MQPLLQIKPLVENVAFACGRVGFFMPEPRKGELCPPAQGGLAAEGLGSMGEPCSTCIPTKEPGNGARGLVHLLLSHPSGPERGLGLTRRHLLSVFPKKEISG